MKLPQHVSWILTPERMLLHPATGTGIVSDLHLGYSVTRIKDGESIPNFTDDVTIARLLQSMQKWNIRELLVAGDVAETPRGGLLILQELDMVFRRMGITWKIIPGNHDRTLPTQLPNLSWHPEGISIDGWLVLHDTVASDSRQIIQGHIHPVVRAKGSTGSVACYLVSENRMLLPAFTDVASGVNILHHADWQTAQCHGIVNNEVMHLGNVATLKQKLYAENPVAAVPKLTRYTMRY